MSNNHPQTVYFGANQCCPQDKNICQIDPRSQCPQIDSLYFEVPNTGDQAKNEEYAQECYFQFFGLIEPECEHCGSLSPYLTSEQLDASALVDGVPIVRMSKGGEPLYPDKPSAVTDSSVSETVFFQVDDRYGEALAYIEVLRAGKSSENVQTAHQRITELYGELSICEQCDDYHVRLNDNQLELRSLMPGVEIHALTRA